MAWFRVDDGFWGHEKVTSLSDSALALWVLAGSWTARYRKDGSLPRDIFKRLGRKKGAVQELIGAGLWVETSDGYAFHDFEQWQKHIVTADDSRGQAAERQRKHRKSRVTPFVSVTNGVTRDPALPPSHTSHTSLSDPVTGVTDDPEQGEPDPEPIPPEPLSAHAIRSELESVVGAEFFARGATSQRAAPGQWLDGAKAVQDALRLKLYPDAPAAIRAFAVKLVDAVAAKKPPALGLALQQVQLGEQRPALAGGRQLSALALARLRVEGT